LSEVRRDPIVLSRVSVISPVRGLRPKEVTLIRHESPQVTVCPFCPGNEFMTPPATLVVEGVDGGVKYLEEDPDLRVSNWLVRVVPNKYPIFTQTNGGSYGYHEVIIEHPNHTIKPYDIPINHLSLIIQVIISRINHLFKDPKVVHAYVFKNYGGGGGASLTHPHTQLVATSITIPSVVEELRFSKRLYKRLGECPYCRLIRKEVNSPRLIYMNDSFAVIAPYAPRNPYETMIIPLTHSTTILEMKDEEITALADVLNKLLTSYKVCLGDIDYNFWIHIAPKGIGNEYYHWHIEFLPMTTLWGGLEKGGNVYVVTTKPEDYSKELKEAINSLKS